MKDAFRKQSEDVHIKNVLKEYSGNHLLYIGDDFLKKDYLSDAKFDSIFYVTNNVDMKLDKHNLVVSQYEELSFLSDTIDAIILPHVLDFLDDPRTVLREMWRVLAPEGKMIIVGYNPSYILWRQNFMSPRPLSILKLKRLLLTFDFEILTFKTFFFRRFITNERVFKRLGFIETVGKICLPSMGGLYLFVVKKPVLTLTPVRKRVRKRKLSIVKGLAEPTTRNSLDEKS